jgi:hypothetical protein
VCVSVLGGSWCMCLFVCCVTAGGCLNLCLSVCSVTAVGFVCCVTVGELYVFVYVCVLYDTVFCVFYVL